MSDIEPDAGNTGVTKYKAGCQDCPKEIEVSGPVRLDAAYTEFDSADERQAWMAEHAKRDDERVVPEHAPFIAGEYTLPEESA